MVSIAKIPSLKSYEEHNRQLITSGERRPVFFCMIFSAKKLFYKQQKVNLRFKFPQYPNPFLSLRTLLELNYMPGAGPLELIDTSYVFFYVIVRCFLAESRVLCADKCLCAA